MSYGIHWFRRDLRVVGNPALERNLARNPGRVLGLFCFDPIFLARPDFSAARFSFFLRTLENLRRELRARGGDLLVIDQGPDKAFPKLLTALEKKKGFGKPNGVSWNRDYEPFARDRDVRIQMMLEREFQIEPITERDHLLIEPTELTKGDPKIEGGGFYQVYTPFKKKWFKLFAETETGHRLREVASGLKSKAPTFDIRWPKFGEDFPFGEKDLLQAYLEETEKKAPTAVIAALPPAGHSAAIAALKEFRDEAIADYPVNRDIPRLRGTSRMSIYLKNGSITVPQIISFLKLTPESPHLKYFEELIWREFYYHILYHRPDVEGRAFIAKYRDLEWENNKQWFAAWCDGRTGFPIVDAGMREMNATGWMHNRVRMIVASFLTKDLLIDWRWGEKYFMEKLVDGDLAPNNGGWQWAASTGCDPQPYFRIFNPTSQGKKFDPTGEYVRRWLPELRDRPLKELHEPTADAIVDHSIQRLRALELYKRARKSDEVRPK